MDLETIVALLIALGVGGITPKLAQAVIDKVRGRDKAEVDAWKQRDTEAKRRRKLEEALHGHRSWCHTEHGAAYEDMPPWPASN